MLELVLYTRQAVCASASLVLALAPLLVALALVPIRCGNLKRASLIVKVLQDFNYHYLTLSFACNITSGNAINELNCAQHAV